MEKKDKKRRRSVRLLSQTTEKEDLNNALVTTSFLKAWLSFTCKKSLKIPKG